jgi:hypothetical protein
MKTLRRSLLSLTAVLILVTTSHAELIGLPVADTAEVRDSGQLEFMPGAVIGDDISFYGLRQTYNVLDGFRAFLDLGAVDFKGSNLDFAGSLGATVCIPGDFIADLAVRTSFYYANTDSTDIIGGTLALVTSDESLLDDLYLYGSFGLDFSQTEQNLETATKTTTEINPLLSLGLIYNCTPSLGLFLEGTYIESPFVGFGIKIR